MFSKKGVAGGGFGGFLVEGTEIDGEVRFTDELRIDGKISGRILSSQGRLIVGENGVVNADIEVGSATIGGAISGTLSAAQRVEILSTGRVSGDIFTPALIIEEGAIFEGRCEMAAAASAATEGKSSKKKQAEEKQVAAGVAS